MTSWTWAFADTFSPDECNAIVEEALKLPEKEGQVRKNDAFDVDKSIRDSEVRWVKRDNRAFRWMFERITLNVLDANKHCFEFHLSNEPRLSFSVAQFTTYSSEHAQHYKWHIDNNPLSPLHTTTDRKLSCSVQLSGESTYEGGQLEFDDNIPEAQLSKNVFKCQGDMIVFPSSLRHRVTPVTSGTRHSLVMWFNGPPLA